MGVEARHDLAERKVAVYNFLTSLWGIWPLVDAWRLLYTIFCLINYCAVMIP
jgi:hypothetical protein